jgi:poly-gamma-glutamate synthesis protein (capsule biosynthesis protein)
LDYQRELGHMAIDFGADMIVGTGSHHIGPIEVYRRKPIFYSLGNFVHDKSSFDNRTMDALLIRCLVRDRKLERVSYVPGKVINHGPPDFTRPADSGDVVELVRDISQSFGTQFEMEENDVTVVLGPVVE